MTPPRASSPTSPAASTPQPASTAAKALDVQEAGSTEKAKPAKRATAKKRTDGRLTAREMVDKAVELAGQRHQPRSTVKLSRAAKGQVFIDVMVQAGDDPQALAVASALAQAEFDRLSVKYGTGDYAGAGGADSD